MRSQIVDRIFATSYQSMKVIKIDLVVLIRFHRCYLRKRGGKTAKEQQPAKQK